LELINLYLQDNNVITFFLLFIRLGAMFAFFPLFSHTSIPVSIKTASLIYLTILFFPITPSYSFEVTISNIIISSLKEVITGFLASILLKITFDMLSFAGENISFAMGLSSAAMFDPVSGTQSTVISSFLNLVAITVLLSFDGHHMILLFMDEYIKAVPLGTLIFNEGIAQYLIGAVKNLFIVGFSMSFPIIALSLFMDIIFGVMMKTIPQFQVMVIGVPIKIALGFGITLAVLSSIIFVWKREFISAFNSLQMFLVY